LPGRAGYREHVTALVDVRAPLIKNDYRIETWAAWLVRHFALAHGDIALLPHAEADTGAEDLG